MVRTKIKPPKLLVKPVGRAISDFGMIKAGDKILLAVSGGKDSLSLFHILRHFYSASPVKFELGVVTIDPQVEGFEPKALDVFFKKFDTPYFFEEFPIMEQAKESMRGDSYCSFCSRIKRGLMYKVARREGYNVLALGQHLDDLAESLMMSMCHNGKIQTMKAHYINDAKDLRIIRPLVYVRERQLADFAKNTDLPVIADSCPACYKIPTEREHFKQWLLDEEKRNKNLYKNLLSAMKPMLDETKGILND
ncbi:MAG: tRNA 2-thiocytidine biosynthesis protein TtcA [Candidatus Thioglobus sp.]|jgi:tRNA(Ile)-lysidine synthase TilS/MesJ|uniref:tRNA 2-thiocytidine biosynthesis TtcA family protein n=1 Tax=Candidatus Thioglobus sp. TaxID=2026721 RepID=UPI001ECA7D75|nr:tRNA 2-thiocytidine biosynthesis TtcA family protein [Candidatus Thioglobus sp.]MBT3187155.1 tRNA 2-thiocytidine biosynthesis protein TtcA [Candidatus Thioglobus sp.]MBT3431108.1 tRNA 2-thiocytidine biosynthesis protein TtcA [Candidatus Thioglobus sp.]MBT3965328.1 tRNA 2-thiocytidine biosynthesis protein TtcA [Candidatus Thioglobus sp.]MBT4315437.1 tRNA 2-thiocytidine biosynthesis protein TtcA [Candidatus Thioglobus sp.]MBT4553155.1 tRNA 2-thiocytidine biosynthesis protein TtcA [Candidatus 